ncbi:MAG: formate/nitrite transporter family protein [Lachnospiraceae bacterium]|nr:formate/nitrite transporter family protein [Lachnospiraceae bacterium]
MNGILSIKEAVEGYIAGAAGKAKASACSIFMKAIMAGAMIALGAQGSSVAAHAIENVGVARLVAGCVFPVGLMMVITMGAELFTGDCLIAMAVADKKVTLMGFVRILVLVFLGNLVGGMLIAWMTMATGQFDYSSGLLGAYTIKVALGKATMPFAKALVSGILCNILVSAAVIVAFCGKDLAGKLWASFFVIMLFVTSGFEHCVANMYYISAGLFAKMNPDYAAKAADAYGIAADKLANLDWMHFFVTNLIPVTIGNIIGGSVAVGLMLYYLNCAKKN